MSDLPNPSRRIAIWAAGIILGIAGVGLLVLATIQSDLNYLIAWLCFTLVSAAIMRLGIGVAAFSFYSVLYTIPITLASLSLCKYLISPPPAGPAGGNAIGMGIVMQLLAVYAPIIALASLVAFRAEKRDKVWYAVLGGLHLPGLILLVLTLSGISG